MKKLSKGNVSWEEKKILWGCKLLAETETRATDGVHVCWHTILMLDTAEIHQLYAVNQFSVWFEVLTVLWMKAASFSEKCVTNYQSERRRISEDYHPYQKFSLFAKKNLLTF
jgi:hypothetical protein